MLKIIFQLSQHLPLKIFPTCRLLICLLTGSTFVAPSAKAQLFPSKQKDQVKAALISEVESVRPGASFWTAIHLKMAPKWHTYWKNPGDAGLATKIQWDLPESFTPGKIQWPFPKKFNDNGIISYGYDDEVFLLTQITVAKSVKAEQIVTIRAKVNWLACKESCIPGNATLTLEIPVTEQTATPSLQSAKIFSDARFKLPLTQSDWKFSAYWEGPKVALIAKPPTGINNDGSQNVFFPDSTFPLRLGAEQTWIKKQQRWILLLELVDQKQPYPQNVQGILTNPFGWRGLETEKSLQVNIPIHSESRVALAEIGNKQESETSIFYAILFAFLGGLILNLMPCVFPVISLKVLGFVNQAQAENTSPVKHALIFSFGILLSFWILGGVLLILRAGGETIGWGFQLQSPNFILFLTILLFLMALNLFGIFEIGLRLTRTGSFLMGKNGWVESFLSGVLATLVATPCTAPYMAPALAFSLSQPPFIALTVFSALGVGMAFPYVLMSKFQFLLDLIPKPGAWMEKFKQFMGFLMLGTVIWLLWVLNSQAGVLNLFIAISSLLVLALSTWIYGNWGTSHRKNFMRSIALSTAFLLFLAGIIFPYTLLSKAPERPSSTQVTENTDSDSIDINWQEFSPEKVEGLKRQGKKIFIDFTAAWCLSCLANERLAFSSTKVKRRFKELGIVPLKADWTNKNEMIAKELAKFGRSGVPLYVLFDGNPNPEPKILPQILTPGIVLEALDALEKQTMSSLDE